MIIKNPATANDLGMTSLKQPTFHIFLNFIIMFSFYVSFLFKIYWLFYFEVLKKKKVKRQQSTIQIAATFVSS